ncbi:MAG TPA: flippase-like domain-containing protein, partial [Acidimicrobiales bacterium]
RRASRTDVLDGLALAGFKATTITATDVGAAHARTFDATTADGRRGFVKLLGRDERDTDWMIRVVKALRVKDLDDERPGWSPSRIVEQEALASLLAGSRGVATPRVLGAGQTDGGDGLLVLDHVDGRCLADLAPDDVTDEILAAVWVQVALLHEQRIAHRWCTAHHVLVDADGTVRLIDFRWSRVAADDDQLAADIAQMIASTAAMVGASRAVAAADHALPDGQLALALPLVQKLTFPHDLQRVVAKQPNLLEEVRDQLQVAANVEKYELRKIERISFARLISLFGGVVLTYSVLSFVTDWRAIGHALGNLNAAYVPGILVLAVLPFVSGAMTFVAVSPRALPFAEVNELMVAQTFLNRFTPANAGGMALRVRYLQRHGVDPASAAAGVGLTSLANGVAQAALVLMFGAWAGSSGKVGFSLPKASTLAVVVAVIALAGGLVWFTPWGRKMVAGRLETTLKQVLGTLKTLWRQPSRFALLLGGAILGKAVTIGAFTQSCRALGVHTPYARLGLLFLTGTTVASAAPTPGGVGAVEAALVAALTGVGVPPGQALSAVLVFRLATFWLPVFPGWLALERLRSRKLV